MAKIDQISNGETGLSVRTKINEALKTVEVDGTTIQGDGINTPLSIITQTSFYPEVNTFADLPAAADHTDEIYVVKQGSGIYMINRKSAGLYLSNGVSWSRLGNIPAYFNDANFEVYNNTDNTKGVKFDVSGVATGTIRTLTIPDESGDVFYTTARKNQAHTELIGGFLGGFEQDAIQGASDQWYQEMSYGGTFTEAIGALKVAATGSTFIIDVYKNSVSILTDKVIIEAGELSSLDAATQPTFSDTAFVKGDVISARVTQIGVTTAGQEPQIILTHIRS